MGWFTSRRRTERSIEDLLTSEERAAYDRYMASPVRCVESQAAWDAMPLWLRVSLCGECGWLDAVYEACPELGREIDGRLHGLHALNVQS